MIKTIRYAQERQQRILDLLRERARLSVPDLERLLRASPATIRRDLSFLDRLGKIVRTHGGVLHPDQASGEISFDRKGRDALNAKISLAEAAVRLLPMAGTVFVDSGTTAFEAGRRLIARGGATVFTNSVPLLSEKTGPDCRVIAVGGEVRAVSLALVGAGAIAWMRQLRFDAALIGASGIDPLEGPCTTELAEADVKRAAVARSRRIFLLADGSKWDRTAPVRFAGWSDIDELFTDRRPPAAELEVLRRHRVNFHEIRPA